MVPVRVKKQVRSVSTDQSVMLVFLASASVRGTTRLHQEEHHAQGKQVSLLSLIRLILEDFGRHEL